MLGPLQAYPHHLPGCCPVWTLQKRQLAAESHPIRRFVSLAFEAMPLQSGILNDSLAGSIYNPHRVEEINL
jgi:hypothetical protein